MPFHFYPGKEKNTVFRSEDGFFGVGAHMFRMKAAVYVLAAKNNSYLKMLLKWFVLELRKRFSAKGGGRGRPKQRPRSDAWKYSFWERLQ